MQLAIVPFGVASGIRFMFQCIYAFRRRILRDAFRLLARLKTQSAAGQRTTTVSFMSEDTSDSFRVFPSTHWSQVASASQAESEAGRVVLNELLKQYQFPLKAHLAAKFCVTEDQRADWFQSFVEKRVLEK